MTKASFLVRALMIPVVIGLLGSCRMPVAPDTKHLTTQPAPHAAAENTENIPWETQPIMWLDRVITTQPAGKNLGTWHFSLSCAGPYGPMYWGDIRRYIRSTQLRQAGQQALVQAGYRPPGNSDDVFQMPWRVRPDWLIGARITNINASLCRDSHWLLGQFKGAISGQISLDIAWQVFDSRTRQTILRTATTGVGTLESGTRDGIAAMMEMAFADAFDALSEQQLHMLVAARRLDAPQTVAAQPDDRSQVPIMDEDRIEDALSQLDDEWGDDNLPEDNPGADQNPEEIQAETEIGGIIKTSLMETHTPSPPSMIAALPTAWNDNLTTHPDALLGGILRTEPGHQAALAVAVYNNKTVLLTPSSPTRQSGKELIVRQDNGTTHAARALDSTEYFQLLEIDDPIQSLVPVFKTIPRTGQPVALISSIKGRTQLEPILTSGLIAQRDKKSRLLWLDVPRTMRDQPMIVLDEYGNALAVTIPEHQQNGLIAARPFDRRILAANTYLTKEK